MLVTSGTRINAWVLVSKSNSVIPAIVVIDVRKIARKRSRTDCLAASCRFMPLLICCFTNTTNKIESLTTMPASETKPIMLGSVKASPIIRWPQIAPISARGMLCRSWRQWVNFHENKACSKWWVLCWETIFAKIFSGGKSKLRPAINNKFTRGFNVSYGFIVSFVDEHIAYQDKDLKAWLLSVHTW